MLLLDVPEVVGHTARVSHQFRNVVTNCAEVDCFMQSSSWTASEVTVRGTRSLERLRRYLQLYGRDVFFSATWESNKAVPGCKHEIRRKILLRVGCATLERNKAVPGCRMCPWRVWAMSRFAATRATAHMA